MGGKREEESKGGIAPWLLGDIDAPGHMQHSSVLLKLDLTVQMVKQLLGL